MKILDNLSTKINLKILKNNTLERVSKILALLLVISIITTIYFTNNKGFNFSDEGGFLLSYKNPTIYKGGIYNFHLIVNHFTNWINPTILMYRWLTFYLLLVTSYFLYIGMKQFINSRYPNSQVVTTNLYLFAIIFVSTFIFYFLGLNIIYNNTLTHFSIVSSTGIILFLLTQNKFIFNKKTIIWILILGVLLVISFFTKFSTAILQFIIYFFIFLIFFIRNHSLSLFIKFLSYFFASITLAITYYFIFIQSYSDWIKLFKSEYSILSDHSPLILINQYIYQFLAFINFSVKYFSWIFLYFLFINIKYKTSHNSLIIKIIKISFLILSISFLIYEIFFFKYHISTLSLKPYNNAYIYLYFILLTLVLILSFKVKEKEKIKISPLSTNYLIYFLLFSTPFIGSVGTANSLFLNVLWHGSTWICLIIILAIYLSKYLKSNLIPNFIIVGILFLTASQVIDGNIFHPYYSISYNYFNPANALKQNYEVKEISKLKNIKVDIKTKKFLKELKSKLEDNGFKKGMPIICYSYPGIVYLMDGISPGVPYLFNAERDILGFKLFNSKKHVTPFVLTSMNSELSPSLKKEMANKGIKYPEKYTLQDSVFFPNSGNYIRIYKPNQ